MTDDKEKCIEFDKTIPELCRPCTARHKGICGALTADELITLNQISSQKHLKSGRTIVADEEEYPYFASVLEGVIKLSKSLPDGRQQIVGLQFAPDFVGRPFLETSNLTVESATDVFLCTTSRKKFEKLLNDSPGLQQRLLKQTLLELDESRQWLVTLGRKSASERVASFLHMIASHAMLVEDGKDNYTSVVYDLPLTRSDMGDFLGLTIETVSRQLSKLRALGIITVSHSRRVEVHSVPELGQIAGQ